MEAAVQSSRKKARNWWKFAFFVSLVLLELARETIVVTNAKSVKFGGFASVFVTSDYAAAHGRWERIGQGSSLAPAVTSIQCSARTKECIEAYSRSIEGFVFPPQISTFPARFTADGVTYENDDPECARYSVRIDAKMRKVFALRERKGQPSNPICAGLDKRLEMQLVDPSGLSSNPLENHFAPLLKIIAALA